MTITSILLSVTKGHSKDKRQSDGRKQNGGRKLLSVKFKPDDDVVLVTLTHFLFVLFNSVTLAAVRCTVEKRTQALPYRLHSRAKLVDYR